MNELKKINDQLSHVMSQPNIDVNLRHANISKLLNNPLIESVKWSDVLNASVDVNVNVEIDVESVIQNMKDNMVLMEKSTLKMEVPVVSKGKKGEPLVELSWSDTIPAKWKEMCVIVIEVKERNGNEKEKEIKEEKEFEERNEWKRIEKIESVLIKNNTLELKHEWRWNEWYLLRMRACFLNNMSFSPFSSQIFHSGAEPKPFDSWILTKQEIKVLLSFLPKTLTKLTLLFRASRDGFTVSQFHKLCDNKGATVTVIESNVYHHVFGGFTNMPWSSSNTYKNDSSAFIFLLRSSNNNQIPEKWNIKSGEEENAIYDNSNCGPRFGRGFDFYLYNNCNTNTNYTNPFSYNGQKSKTALAGAYNFKVKDYEVYKVDCEI